MAYYGDMFCRYDTQGDGAEELPADDFVEELAVEWLLRAAHSSASTRQRALAQHELDALALAAQDQDVQGVRAAGRPLINAVARLPWFGRAGMGLAAAFVARSLVQVSTYFSDETVRSQAIDRVLALIDEETQVVVGHSLGSVVAFEALHLIDQPINLFATLGSPLGLRSVIYDRLRPQPPSTPRSLRAWTNLADSDDLVAADPSLKGFFQNEQTVLSGTYLVDNGSRPHDAVFYLRHAELGASIAAALGDDAR